MAGIDSKMAGIATYLPHFFYTAELVSMDDFLWYTDDDDDNFKSFIYIDSLCPKSFRRKRRTDVSHKFSYFFCTDDLINSYVLGEFDLRIFRVFKFRP